jgi:hypothetical protein
MSCWHGYEPTAKNWQSIGVDSSWNKRSFQGLDLYAVDALAVNSENEILAVEWDTALSIIRNEMLESKALFMKSIVTENATKKSILVISFLLMVHLHPEFARIMKMILPDNTHYQEKQQGDLCVKEFRYQNTIWLFGRKSC